MVGDARARAQSAAGGGDACMRAETGKSETSLDPFCCVPQASLQRMKQLLTGGDPAARVVLLIGFYSTELRSQYEALGFEVISVDYRFSEGPGMHYVGDARDVMFARRYAVVIAAPPCRNLCWSAAGTFQEKQQNGLQYFGFAFALLLWNLPADVIVLEQARSVLSRALGNPQMILHPKDLAGGNGEQKTTFLWIRHSNLRLLLDGDSIGSWQRAHDIFQVDKNKAEIEKARWSDALSRAVARVFNPNTCAPRQIVLSAQESFFQERSVFACRWAAEWQLPLPAGWDSPDAKSPNGEEAFSIACDDEGRPKVMPLWMQQNLVGRQSDGAREIRSRPQLSSGDAGIEQRTSKVSFPDDAAHVCLFDSDDPPSNLIDNAGKLAANGGSAASSSGGVAPAAPSRRAADAAPASDAAIVASDASRACARARHALEAGSAAEADSASGRGKRARMGEQLPRQVAPSQRDAAAKAIKNSAASNGVATSETTIQTAALSIPDPSAQGFKKGTGSSPMWTGGYMPTSHGSPGSGERRSESATLARHTGAAEGSGRRSPALQDLPHSATKGAATSDHKKEVDEATGSVRCVWRNINVALPRALIQFSRNKQSSGKVQMRLPDNHVLWADASKHACDGSGSWEPGPKIEDASAELQAQWRVDARSLDAPSAAASARAGGANGAAKHARMRKPMPTQRSSDSAVLEPLELEACQVDTAARRAQAKADGMSPGRLMEAPILVLPFAFCEGKPCVLLPTGQENAVLAAGRNGAQLAVKREDAKSVALAALQACGMESQVTLACSWRRDVHVIIALCDGGDVSREELERSKPALTNGSNCGGLVWAELGSLNSERYVLAADAALRLAQLISPVRARASALAVVMRRWPTTWQETQCCKMPQSVCKRRRQRANG